MLRNIDNIFAQNKKRNGIDKLILYLTCKLYYGKVTTTQYDIAN